MPSLIIDMPSLQLCSYPELTKLLSKSYEIGGQIPIEKHYHSLEAKNEVEFNCQPQTMEVTNNRILTVLKKLLFKESFFFSELSFPSWIPADNCMQRDACITFCNPLMVYTVLNSALSFCSWSIKKNHKQLVC